MLPQVCQAHSACILCADIYADVCSVPTRPTFHYGGSYLLNAVQAIQKQDVAAEGPRDELQQYLKSGAESTTDMSLDGGG
jgi:hypothetical protein